MMNRFKIRFPILVKLTLLISLLLVSIALVIAWKNSEFFEKVSEQREESASIKNVKTSAYLVETLMKSYVEKATFFALDMMNDENEIDITKVLKTKFNNDSDLIALEIKIKNEGESILFRGISNDDFRKTYSIKNNYFSFLSHKKEELVYNGDIKIENLSNKKFPMLRISFPLISNEKGSFSHIIVSYFKIDRLQKSFDSSGDKFMFLVNEEGVVMSHPDEEKVIEINDFSDHPMVENALESKIKIKQKYFESDEGGRVLGAYAKTVFGLILVSGTLEESIKAPAIMAKKYSYYILGLILSVAFFFIFVFSSRITNPIVKLKGFADEIGHGNFELEITKEVNSQDEVGDLARSFDNMLTGLRERDQIKSMFNKFHGSSITDDLLNSELDRGGSRKNVTVFFSDIRGFTDFSEHHTAEEVVEMLNEYFEAMVSAILKHNGVVDKFIGDAIMAVWGIPEAKEGTQDAIDCVNACLDMRVALNEYNQKRITDGKDPIKMGMGIHLGAAISGTIGASERMEYTVIGDTVNTAARIEASTKAFGTDLLISEELYQAVKEHFIVQKAGEVEVKGKANGLSLHTVLGKIHADGTQEIIKTPYSSYTAEKAGKVKVTA